LIEEFSSRFLLGLWHHAAEPRKNFQLLNGKNYSLDETVCIYFRVFGDVTV
jgi:hypothetical protein